MRREMTPLRRGEAVDRCFESSCGCSPLAALLHLLRSGSVSEQRSSGAVQRSVMKNPESRYTLSPSRLLRLPHSAADSGGQKSAEKCKSRKQRERRRLERVRASACSCPSPALCFPLPAAALLTAAAASTTLSLTPLPSSQVSQCCYNHSSTAAPRRSLSRLPLVACSSLTAPRPSCSPSLSSPSPLSSSSSPPSSTFSLPSFPPCPSLTPTRAPAPPPPRRTSH